jgi:hypothetical protein
LLFGLLWTAVWNCWRQGRDWDGGDKLKFSSSLHDYALGATTTRAEWSVRMSTDVHLCLCLHYVYAPHRARFTGDLSGGKTETEQGQQQQGEQAEATAGVTRAA